MIPDEDDDEWSLWLGLSGMLVIQGKSQPFDLNESYGMTQTPKSHDK